MAAPMVRNFFEPLKDEIKEIIEPPKKALLVFVEGENGGQVQDVVAPPVIPNEGEILRALPVEGLGIDPEPAGEVLRALPVDETFIVEDDEVVE